MSNLKPIEGMYVCFLDGVADFSSIGYLRRYSINKTVQGSAYTWKEIQKFGWECKKVNISFEEIIKNPLKK